MKPLAKGQLDKADNVIAAGEELARLGFDVREMLRQAREFLQQARRYLESLP